MTRNCLVLALSTALAAAPFLATASTITLRRDDVVPVIFEDSLTIHGNRSGDHFAARVDDSRYLPNGTRLEGRVAGIQEGRDGQPGMMDLEFTTVILPDGTRRDIDALPVPLTNDYVTKDRDGRFTVKNDVHRKERTVLGGLLGGFVFGSIFHKQLEGTVIGAVAGILLAQADKSNDGNTIVNKGDRLGAIMNRDFSFDWQDRGNWRDNNGNDGWRNDGNNAPPARGDDNGDWRDDGRGDRNDRNDRNDRRDDDGGWNGNDHITYGLRELRFNDRERPYVDSRVVMVPLRATALQMGLRINHDEARENPAVFVEGPDGYLQFDDGGRDCKVNGRLLTFDRGITMRDRVQYVPLEALVQVAREAVFVNGSRLHRRTRQ